MSDDPQQHENPKNSNGILVHDELSSYDELHDELHEEASGNAHDDNKANDYMPQDCPQKDPPMDAGLLSDTESAQVDRNGGDGGNSYTNTDTNDDPTTSKNSIGRSTLFGFGKLILGRERDHEQQHDKVVVVTKAAEKAKSVAIQQMRKALNKYVIKNLTTVTTTTTTTRKPSNADSPTSAAEHPSLSLPTEVQSDGSPVPASTITSGANDTAILLTTTTTTTAASSWHFRSWFVVEVTLFHIFVIFVSLAIWMLNRQTHMRPTKGSKITHKKKRKRRRHRRKKSQPNATNDDGTTGIASNTVVVETEKQKIHEGKVANDINDFDPYDDQDSASSVSSSSSVRNSQDHEGDHVDDHDDLDLELEEEASANLASQPTALASPIEKSRRAAKRRRSRRQSYQTLLASHNPEHDEDGGTKDTTSNKAGMQLPSGYQVPADPSATPTNNGSDSVQHERINERSSTKLRELYKVMNKVKLFSYLHPEAMKLCGQHAHVIQLQPHQTLFAAGQLDGSFYAVLSGKIRCRFENMKVPDEEPASPEDVSPEHPEWEGKLGMTFGAGHNVTSLLAMLAGMVHHDKHRFSSKDGDGITGEIEYDRSTMAFANHISAAALDEPTQVICVPPTCFSLILERYPADVQRIAQTVLARTQRLTAQCLIDTLGMRSELLKPAAKANHVVDKSKIESWNMQLQLPGQHKAAPKTAGVFQDAMKEFLQLLGIPGSDQNVTLLKSESRIHTLNKEHETLIESGVAHDHCYLLLKGELETGIQTPKMVNKGVSAQNSTGADEISWPFLHHTFLEPGAMLGEYVCFTNDISLFTVRCSSQDGCVLLQVPKQCLSTLILQYPSIAMSRVLDVILDRIPSVVHLLAWSSEWLHVEAADSIVAEGESCDSLYLVLNGRLRASKNQKSKGPNREPDEEFGRGKVVGHVECLTGSPWPYDLYAIRNSELVCVPLRTLLVIIHAFPSAGLHFARAIAARVHSKNPSELPNSLPSYGLQVATVAIIPLAEMVNYPSFYDHVVTSFSQNAPCKLLTKRKVQDEVGEAPPPNSNRGLHDLKMTRFLAGMEENNRLVIYQADARYTWWTKLCIQQADCILLVVDACTAPNLHRLEQSLIWAYESMHVRIDLIVVGQHTPNQDDDDYFKATKAKNVTDDVNSWSEKRKWIAGHHVTRLPFEQHKQDFARMSRRVCGNSLGLVLGGGGARGLAHLGVYRALLELGVTVDVVGGTSQGAFVGALMARHPDDYEFVHQACLGMAVKMSSVREKLFDLTLPMTSTFNGYMFNRVVRKTLGPSTRIQDLVLNFFCVSVDLLKPEQVVHTKGVLWKYVRASMSLSGYLPPVAENGKYLVDGGYMNVLPADVMRHSMGARTVISVDVSPESVREYHNYGTQLSGWWLLWNSWNPFVKTVKVPSMMDLNGLLVWASSEQHLREVKFHSDLNLVPPVREYGTLEYDKFDEIVEKSYRSSKPILEEYVKKNPWLVTPTNAEGTSTSGTKATAISSKTA